MHFVLFRVIDSLRLADDVDLDLTGILQLRLDLARQMRIDAENSGKAAIDAAAAKADNELAELRRQADEKAMDAAGGLSKERRTGVTKPV